jgi:hypothetical protein
MYIMKFFILLLIAASISFLSNGQHHEMQVDNNSKESKRIIIKEVIQTSNYTYLLTLEKKIEKWLAIPKTNVEVGDTCYYVGGMQMIDFYGKEANKTFDTIIFLGKSNFVADLKKENVKEEIKQHKTKDTKENISIGTVEGTISIAEIFENKMQYKNKIVKIKAKVTKYNTKILGNNWLHLQDGSDFNGKYDLTATSIQEFEVGDTVLIQGKVTLEKDFGYGYFFEVLLEESKKVE